jgi:hypothetical protein
VAAAGAPAGGVVLHQDTQLLSTFMTNPEQTWVGPVPRYPAQTAHFGGYATLGAPTLPHPSMPLRGSAATNSDPTYQPFSNGCDLNSSLLNAPFVHPIFSHLDAAAAPPLAVDESDNVRSARPHTLRSTDFVPDPLHPGRLISIRALRNRQDLVEDPRQNGHFITYNALRQRRRLVPDPLRPGLLISANGLRRRQDTVEDPRRPGHFVTRAALRQRQRVVEDPQRPGSLITLGALRRREARVEDPLRPGSFVAASTLRRRETRQR